MRSLRTTSCLLVFAAALASVGCQHSASSAAKANASPAQPNSPAQSNQTNASQAQAANSPAQPADSQIQPANPPAQAETNSNQSAPVAAPAQTEAQSAPSSAPNPAPLAQPAPNAQTPQAGSSSAQNQPPQVTIPDGTPIDIRLTQSLGSLRSAGGQSFAATLDAPIVVDNAVVVPRGANVTGRVLFAKRSGRLKGPAELAVTLTSIEADGQDYRIVTSHKSWRGASHKKRNLAWIGGGGGGGALVGAVAGGGVGAAIGAGVGAGGGTVTAFVTGRKNIVLPSETRLRFVLRRPVTVSEG